MLMDVSCLVKMGCWLVLADEYGLVRIGFFLVLVNIDGLVRTDLLRYQWSYEDGFWVARLPFLLEHLVTCFLLLCCGPVKPW